MFKDNVYVILKVTKALISKWGNFLSELSFTKIKTFYKYFNST